MSQAAVSTCKGTQRCDLPCAQFLTYFDHICAGLTFDDIAKAIGRDEVWTAAAFYGQVRLFPPLSSACRNFVNSYPGQIYARGAHQVKGAPRDRFGPSAEIGDQWWPSRGLGPIPPTDPVIYRLYEGVLVYGHSIKAIIHEKFGDGIMSMIDCKINIAKKEDPKGDRVILTFDGKFLPYAKW
ncbi:cyanate lyase C-terminal domain-containing protein [Mycena leptocephala]|nr:cyanate lyase C-terminal domain-containing protein [Mycena leptocephala]